jgi:ATP-binding cassette, subfamily C, bacterial LapB
MTDPTPAARVPALRRPGEDIGVVRAEPLVDALRGGRLGDFEAVSPFAACLMPLLDALGWRGDPRHIVEALPHFAADLDLDTLRNVLAELGYATRPTRARLRKVDPRLLPCLHVGDDGVPRVVLAAENGGVRVFDGATRVEAVRQDGPQGTAYLVEYVETTKESEAQGRSFSDDLARRFRPVTFQLALITLVTDILTLLIPFYSMTVYDRVIGAETRSLLFWLTIGVAGAFAFDFALKAVRARLLAYTGARVERLVAVAVLRQLLRLPVGYVESAPVSQQLSRLKEFDQIRDFFTGPMAGVALDLPFLFIFLIAIWWLGGPLVMVPIVLGLAIAALGWITMNAQTEANKRGARARAARHGITVEIVSNLRAIKQLGGRAIWLDRFRALSAAAAHEGYRSQMLGQHLQTISQGLMMFAGAATLAWGATMIVDGTMTVGALIATMALVWRVLAPLQMGLMTLQRLDAMRGSIRQIDGLLRLKPELQERAAPSVVQRVFRGAVKVNRVSLRYRPDAEPAMLGVELEAKPGEMIGLTGNSGAGKSTVLKVIAGLYQPQAGTVMLDGLDIRQMSPSELRNVVTYAPQNRHLFYGTVAQNLRLANPTATEASIRDALAEAGALDETMGLPKGLETMLGDSENAGLPAGLLQRIALARVYLRPASVLLFDEPGQWLDQEGDRALIAALKARKGKQTILLVSHRPSHLALCDRVALFDHGQLVRLKKGGEAAPPGAAR